jgi:hypothetical protein
MCRTMRREQARKSLSLARIESATPEAGRSRAPVAEPLPLIIRVVLWTIPHRSMPSCSTLPGREPFDWRHYD